MPEGRLRSGAARLREETLNINKREGHRQECRCYCRVFSPAKIAVFRGLPPKANFVCSGRVSIVNARGEASGDQRVLCKLGGSCGRY